MENTRLLLFYWICCWFCYRPMCLLKMYNCCILMELIPVLHLSMCKISSILSILVGWFGGIFIWMCFWSCTLFRMLKWIIMDVPSQKNLFVMLKRCWKCRQFFETFKCGDEKARLCCLTGCCKSCVVNT